MANSDSMMCIVQLYHIVFHAWTTSQWIRYHTVVSDCISRMNHKSMNTLSYSCITLYFTHEPQVNEYVIIQLYQIVFHTWTTSQWIRYRTVVSHCISHMNHKSMNTLAPQKEFKSHAIKYLTFVYEAEITLITKPVRN